MQQWGCCFLLQFLLSPAVLCWVQQYRGDQEAALLLQLFSWFVLDNSGLLREGEKNGLEGRGGGKRRRKLTGCKTLWGFPVLSYSCRNCSCMCGHGSKWLNLLQFNPPAPLSWIGADQTSSSWQLNPYPFTVLRLKNK